MSQAPPVSSSGETLARLPGVVSRVLRPLVKLMLAQDIPFQQATDLLKQVYVDVAVAVQRVPHTARGWLHKAGNEGVIKLVADRATRTLVGATVAGPNGGEVLGLLALAVHAQVPVSQLRTMIYAYPTFHRGIEDAVGQLELG